MDQHMVANHPIDIIIKEKQAIYHQLQVEIQKRLMTEKELGDCYHQLETLQKHSNQPFIDELTRLLEITKNDNDSLIQQADELSQDNQLLRDRCGFLESEIESLKVNVIEELNKQSQALMKENEYLRQKVDINSFGGLELGPRSQQDELIQKKNKEIYELTVQLGCLKEENNQFKKD